LQSEKEKKKRADSMIEECRDRLRQAEKEKEYALTHQKKVEILIEKLVFYEKCWNCDRKAYQQAKERYENQRNGLKKKYEAKKTGFHVMIVALWLYAVESTVFAAMRSEEMANDFFIFIGTIWKVLCWFGKCILFVGRYVAQMADKASNETAATAVYWLLQIVVVVGLAGGMGIFLMILGRKAAHMYRENCWDVVSGVVAVTSVAVVAYFGDCIKAVTEWNLFVILLLVHAVYVGIRTYVRGCKRNRGCY